MQPKPNEEMILRYREAVMALFEANSEEKISNSLHDHAAVLIEQFFGHAKNSVRIFCKELSSVVYDQKFVVDQLKSALNRGISVEVVIQEKKPESKKFVEILLSCGGKLFKSTSEKVCNAKFNFAVMDKQATRIEKSNDTCEATASIHSESAGELYQLFDEIKKLGVETIDARC